MAAPLPTGKKSVNLAGPVRVSRIRRDPPPIAQKISVSDPEDRDTRTVVIGIVSFALAIAAVILGFSTYQAWSPQHVTVRDL
jgi:hypothetical protein